MLKPAIKRKLESLTQLPSIPYVISEILNAVDNDSMSAKAMANLIEKDQALTAKLLRVANSPFYGFSRRISTIDLAIVILGLNTLKEIVLSLMIERLVLKVRQDIFDLKSFWQYSVFCGAAGRVLARKMNYRLAGEAFVAGLMHDVGYLIMLELFSKQFLEIRRYQVLSSNSLLFFENKIIGNAHTEIGEWFAEKWNLPPKICEAIRFHHSDFEEVVEEKEIRKLKKQAEATPSKKKRIQLSNTNEDNDNDNQLIIIVALSEWFAQEMGFKNWARESKRPNLFLAESIIDDFSKHDLLNEESALELLKQEIMDEYSKASVLTDVNI